MFCIMFCKPNPIMISRSLLCLMVVLLVICCLLQLVSGRLKYPAMTTFGGFVCVFYTVLSENRARLQAIGDGH